MPYHLAELARVTALLPEASSGRRPRVLTGGLAFAGLPDAAGRLGADALGQDAADAVSIARAWWQAEARTDG
mgnify:FL=1